MAAKRQAKVKLAAYLKEHMNLDADVDSLFDCQFKRIHEYKRQFLNCLYLIHRYLTIKQASPAERAKIMKRTSILGGKAPRPTSTPRPSSSSWATSGRW